MGVDDRNLRFTVRNAPGNVGARGCQREATGVLGLLTLAGLGLVALAVPLALLVGAQTSAGVLVLAVVGGSGIGLAVFSVAALSALWLARDPEGRTLPGVFAWMICLGLGMYADLQVLLRNPPAAVIGESASLSPDVLAAGALAIASVGALGLASAGVRAIWPRGRLSQ